MKKTKFILFFLLVGLSIFCLTSLKVSAYDEYPDANKWAQYVYDMKYGRSRIQITLPPGYTPQDNRYFFIYLNEPYEYNGENISGYYRFDSYSQLGYFAPELVDVIYYYLDNWYIKSFARCVEEVLGISNFSGYLSWNFERKWYQVKYFEWTVEDYINYQINHLTSLIVDLENQLLDKDIEIQQLEMQIAEFEDMLEAEFSRGYQEAINEIDALEEIVPSAFGSIWLVVKDFLSIEVLGIAIWEVVGAFVSVALAIIIIRTFLK